MTFKYNTSLNILLVRSGSMAYGTNIATSDEDTKGIFIMPKHYRLNIFDVNNKERDEVESNNPDIVLYEVAKFLKLAMQCNPNIVEVLYTDESDILFKNRLGQKLIDNKHLFLTTLAADTFTGYASGQISRMKTHYNHNQNPPEKPDRKNLGLPLDGKLISGDELKKINATCGFRNENKPTDTRLKIVVDHFGEKIAQDWFKEQNYAHELAKYQTYLNWKTNRNPERYEMESAYGFDGKFGLHTVRLLRMGIEILSGKGVIVKRPDFQELLDIRNGKWSYEKLIAEAEKLNVECKELKSKSNLPDKVNVEKITELYFEIIDNDEDENKWYQEYNKLVTVVNRTSVSDGYEI